MNTRRARRGGGISDGRRRFSLGLAATPMLAALSACASRGAPPKLPIPGDLTKNAGRVSWQASVGRGGYGFVPAIYDGRLWSASSDGELAGFDIETGRRVAQFDVGTQLASGVASDGSILVVTDAEGSLHGVSSEGKSLWRVPLNAEAASVPAVGGGVVVIRLSDNSVASFDVADGSVRWRYTRRNRSLVLRQTSAIAMDPVNAYVGLPGGRVVALSLATGATLWEAGISLPRGANEIERIADVVAAPILSGSSLCAAAYQGRVTCVDRDSGQAQWTQNVKAGSGTDLSNSRIVVTDVRSAVFAYTRSGERAWEQTSLLGRHLGPPRLFDGRVWIGDANGFVHVLDETSGNVVGRIETDGTQIFSAPIGIETAGKRGVIVQTAGGTIASVTS